MQGLFYSINYDELIGFRKDEDAVIWGGTYSVFHGLFKWKF